MPKAITPVSTDATAAITLADQEAVTEASLEAVLQAVWNHIQFVKDNAGGSASLTPNTFLGRAATGAAGAKPITDLGLALLALGTGVAWTDAQRTVTTMASASVMDIGAAAGEFISVTGNTTITSFPAVPTLGTRRVLFFTSSLTVDHSSNLLLPTLAPIVVQAGDVMELVTHISGRWKCVNFLRADGTPLAGGGSGVSSGTAGKIQIADGAGNFSNDNLSFIAGLLALGASSNYRSLDVPGAGLAGLGGNFATTAPEITGTLEGGTLSDVIALLRQLVNALNGLGAIRDRTA